MVQQNPFVLQTFKKFDKYGGGFTPTRQQSCLPPLPGEGPWTPLPCGASWVFEVLGYTVFLFFWIENIGMHACFHCLSDLVCARSVGSPCTFFPLPGVTILKACGFVITVNQGPVDLRINYECARGSLLFDTFISAPA